MGKIKPLIIIIAAAVCLLVTYFAFRAISSLKQGYSWQEMDWQHRGKTSLSDFFAASDIGKREVIQENKKCIEYYAYKDGLPVKTVCPNGVTIHRKIWWEYYIEKPRHLRRRLEIFLKPPFLFFQGKAEGGMPGEPQLHIISTALCWSDIDEIRIFHTAPDHDSIFE